MVVVVIYCTKSVTPMTMFHQLRRLCARPQVARLAQRRGYSVGTRRCPSCGSGLPTALPVCPACRYVWKVEDSITHHELLGLPYGPNPFVVDRGELRRRFLEAQRLCHPDGWATRSEARTTSLSRIRELKRYYRETRTRRWRCPTR